MYEWEINTRELSNLRAILDHCLAGDDTFQLHGSYGDIYIQAACVYEKIIKENKKYNIFIDQRYGGLLKKHEKKGCRILLISGNEVNRLFNKYEILGNKINLPIRMLPTIYPMIPELIADGLLDYNEFVRKLVDLQPKQKYIGIEDEEDFEIAKTLLIEKKIKLNKTILFSLDNNTHNEIIEEDALKLTKYFNNNGWDILINDSGSIGNLSTKYNELKKKYKSIKVPPELSVSIVKNCGLYIGGSNGFTTIQGLFNKTPGVHILGDGIHFEGKYLIDKFQNKVDIQSCKLSEASKNHFNYNHLEVNYTNNKIEDVLLEIEKYLRDE